MKSSSPLISIIVPTYNAAPFLPALCESILAQSYENFEALFYDDGSTDGSLDVLRRFEGESRFRIVRSTQNRGVNAATNELFKVFRGEFWCHPGADDLLLPKFIERRVALFETNPNAVLAHGPVAKVIDEKDGEIEISGPVNPPLPQTLGGEDALTLLLQHNVIATSSIMVRSSITRTVIPYFQTNWKYAQDWYLWLLHVATGGDVLWDDMPLHIYRVHSGSLSNVAEKAAVRRAETRLVPLVAMARARDYSPIAAAVWNKWKDVLYSLWLVRAASLKNRKVLDPGWMRTAAEAYYGAPCETSLARELLKHGPSVALSFLRERSCHRKQVFPVAGLAQVDHPLFRRASTTS